METLLSSCTKSVMLFIHPFNFWSDLSNGDAYLRSGVFLFQPTVKCGHCIAVKHVTLYTNCS